MRTLVIIGLVIIGGLGIYYLINQNTSPEIAQINPEETTTQPEDTADIPRETMIAEGLDTPWGIVFLPNGDMLFTERAGTVRLIQNGTLNLTPVSTLTTVREVGEGGLLGIDIHPEFASNNLVYLYYTYSSAGDNTLNRVVRMTYRNGKLNNENIIVDAIPGASNHNGGRIKFGPDNYLYITTGDAQEPSQAQSTSSLAGKILRVTDTGQPAQGNPFNNRIYSYGHRNPQGLAWDNTGRLWATEHGRSGIPSGLDELNLIESGKNYGWPEIQGDETAAGMEKPKSHSGSTTWAPAGATFLSNSIYFGGLRGQSLYQAMIQGTEITEIKELYNGQYGRIREVIKGPDGLLYISTSNRDGRGTPSARDDQIIRINPGTPVD